MGARLNGWSHRFRRKAERLEKESTNPECQPRKRSAYSNQAIPTAVPGAPEHPGVSGDAIRMDRADYRNEQRDSVASQLPVAKRKHVAQCDDQLKGKIRCGPARPGDVEHSCRRDQQPKRDRNPLLRFAVYGGGFHRCQTTIRDRTGRSVEPRPRLRFGCGSEANKAELPN